jgi:hypothetical protein
MLAATRDPDPATTLRIESLLSDIGARRPSDVMSPEYRAWYDSSPGSRAWYARQLGGAPGQAVRGAPHTGGKSLWGGEPLARVLHYSTDVKGTTFYLSVGVNADGKVATFDFYSRKG